MIRNIRVERKVTFKRRAGKITQRWWTNIRIDTWSNQKNKGKKPCEAKKELGEKWQRIWEGKNTKVTKNMHKEKVAKDDEIGIIIPFCKEAKAVVE